MSSVTLLFASVTTLSIVLYGHTVKGISDRYFEACWKYRKAVEDIYDNLSSIEDEEARQKLEMHTRMFMREELHMWLDVNMYAEWGDLFANAGTPLIWSDDAFAERYIMPLENLQGRIVELYLKRAHAALCADLLHDSIQLTFAALVAMGSEPFIPSGAIGDGIYILTTVTLLSAGMLRVLTLLTYFEQVAAFEIREDGANAVSDARQKQDESKEDNDECAPKEAWQGMDDKMTGETE